MTKEETAVFDALGDYNQEKPWSIEAEIIKATSYAPMFSSNPREALSRRCSRGFGPGSSYPQALDLLLTESNARENTG